MAFTIMGVYGAFSMAMICHDFQRLPISYPHGLLKKAHLRVPNRMHLCQNFGEKNGSNPSSYSYYIITIADICTVYIYIHIGHTIYIYIWLPYMLFSPCEPPSPSIDPCAEDWYGEAQYGFYDLLVSKNTISITSINWNLEIKETTTSTTPKKSPG